MVELALETPAETALNHRAMFDRNPDLFGGYTVEQKDFIEGLVWLAAEAVVELLPEASIQGKRRLALTALKSEDFQILSEPECWAWLTAKIEGFQEFGIIRNELSPC